MKPKPKPKSRIVDHPANAGALVRDPERLAWHDGTLWHVRSKRDRAARSIPEWEELRGLAAAIKAQTVAELPTLLESFTAHAERHGAQVHFARDAEEHNAIVLRLLREAGAKKVVKSKSMLTEECHLNPFLEEHGVEVVDTDLGERIVQLRGEPPSHIVLPAIHLKKEEIGALFYERLGTPEGASDPILLTEAARQHLRSRFLAADAAITGVNFAIAETGGIVVCTNEGNADLGVSLPRLHIACMGLEKIVPRAADLGVFVRLLARSATGQAITTYTSHFHGPRPGAAMHIVVVDNGRIALRGREALRRSLACIRCGACMNTCPVYRRSGGHSYDNTIPGPIGAILSTASDPRRNQTLPFACSLCGSCTDVCPVKIDLHPQLLTLRQELSARGVLPFRKRLALRIGGVVLARRWLYQLAGVVARAAVRRLPRALLYGRWNPWGRGRELPAMPPATFRTLYERRAAAVTPGQVRHLPLLTTPTQNPQAGATATGLAMANAGVAPSAPRHEAGPDRHGPAAPTRASRRRGRARRARTDARAVILEDLRAQQVPAAPERTSMSPAMSAPTGARSTFPDPLAAFQTALRAAGGEAIWVDDLAAARAALVTLPAYAAAGRVVSRVPGLGLAVEGTTTAPSRPHSLADVDVAIVPGRFAVAENGAVWIDDEALPERALFVLCQHLVLVVPADQIVHDMHEAYARLDVAARPFGAFVAGPSKTADIEQALVIGAHGARSLHVLVVGPVGRK